MKAVVSLILLLLAGDWICSCPHKISDSTAEEAERVEQRQQMVEAKWLRQ